MQNQSLKERGKWTRLFFLSNRFLVLRRVVLCCVTKISIVNFSEGLRFDADLNKNVKKQNSL